MNLRQVSVAALMLGLVLFAPVPSQGQQPGKVYRIGLLLTAPRPQIQGLIEALESGLRDAGYVEGRNIAMEYRSAEGRPERLPALAEDLVKLGVDLIVATSTPAAAAVKRATAKIPTVMVSPADPVASGLVASLARPGGNITGVTLEVTAETVGKQLELLKESLPKGHLFGVLWNPAYPPNESRWKAAEQAVRRLGLVLTSMQVREPAEMERAFNGMRRERAHALLVLGDPLTFSLRGQIAAIASKNKLPTMSPYREAAEAGGFIAYGPDFQHMYRRAGSYIARILNGATPGDLPVEQPSKFDLVINLKTAKALRLTIPQSLLMRADEVIQ